VEPSLLDALDISLDHLFNEGAEAGGAGVPAEHGGGLGWVTNQKLDLSRAVVLGIDTNANLAGLGVLANFLLSLTLPHDGHIDDLEGLLHKLAHRVLLTSGKNEVVGGVMLQHPPHSLFFKKEKKTKKKKKKKKGQESENRFFK